MKYAVAHAPVGSSVILSWDQKGGSVETITLSSDKEKTAFIEKLGADDTVYMCLGGAESRLALACIIRGAKVERISVHDLGEEAAENHLADEEVEYEKAEDNAEDDDAGHEAVEEDSRELERRKERARKICAAAMNAPNLFYDTRPIDIDILILVVLVKGFMLMQRARIATHLRLISSYRDMYLVDAASQKTKQSEEKYLLDRLSKVDSFGLMPPEARIKYLEGIKAGDDIYEVVTDREKELFKEIKKRLDNLSLYREVFESIKGCGPLIAAYIIGAIGDIRRFPNDAKLKAYAGYHHFPDGSRARRVKGKPARWSPALKQAVWKFTEQVVKTPAGASESRIALDRRRAYELLHLLSSVNNYYLPSSLQARLPIESVKQVTVEDTEVLLAAIDSLRGVAEMEIDGEAGKKRKVLYGEWLAAKFASRPELLALTLAAYNEAAAKFTKGSAKNLKGIKARGLEKAKRWLGQRFIRYDLHMKWTEWQKRQAEADIRKAA